MASNSFVMKALPNSHIGAEDPVDFWDTCPPEDIERFLSSEFEVWLYDIDSLTNDHGDGKIMDLADPVSLEFPPVQKWVLGQEVSREFVSKNSRLIGLGSEFTFKDVEAEFPLIKLPPMPKLEVPSRSKSDRVCPWCGVTAVRRYNFNRPAYFRESELPEEMENPVLWTDGAWSEKGVDPDSTEFIENQYGDCVVTCPACSAMFLASMVEPYDSIAHKPPMEFEGQNDHRVQLAAQELVVPGAVAKGHFEKTLSEEWIVTANLEQTLAYLEASIDSRGPFWSEWTAAQQLVNWVSHLERIGESITPEQDERGRKALALVIESSQGILEGVFGSFYAYNNHSNESLDENYWIHTHALEESIPLSNMMRIASVESELDKLPPSNVLGVYTLEELDREPTYDFDEYIIRRQLLIHELKARKDSRWAVHSGQLQDEYPSMSNKWAKGDPVKVEDLGTSRTKLDSEFVPANQGKLDYNSVLALPPEYIQVELRRFADVLHPRESVVLRSRFGLGDGMPKSYTEIAESFGVKPKRIRRIETETLERLRGLNLSLELREFLG